MPFQLCLKLLEKKVHHLFLCCPPALSVVLGMSKWLYVRFMNILGARIQQVTGKAQAVV